MKNQKYQLVLAGSSLDYYRSLFLQSFIQHLNDIGLDEQQYFQFLEVSQAERIDWDGLPVMIWFGGESEPSADEVALLNRFLQESFYVFPIVDSLTRYPSLVPAVLRHLNGLQWEPNRVVADILKAFRLCREQRQAFISYRRMDSQNVAIQLFSALSLQGYKVFLDIASIDAGVDFQQVLWGRMSDVDLLIFLDSPNALSSEWVYKELLQAESLGLGVLQLVWVDHTRKLGTEFSTFIQLQHSDFAHCKADAQDSLTGEAIKTILSTAESARIRSIAIRRTRVIGDVVEQLPQGIASTIDPGGNIRLYRDDRALANVIPVVGVPDAALIQQAEIRALAEDVDLSKNLIIYDSLGVEPNYKKHLAWLNGRLELRTSESDSVENWLNDL
ncbi:MAG: toll/interleukin-1 receptor domain-containing protein [Myxacorys chilensis ATA2-1-KO14]|jgi:hypothetical protein|nr:toll/interleukin-1 receptor domain-containing protein [Myxacorys chilensis ATA2-1-KO14]